MEQHEKGPEGGPKLIFLQRLRAAFDNKNLPELRASLDYIQERAERGGINDCSPMSDLELKQLLETGKGMIAVGTGTSGQRIYIDNGEMYMPCNSEKDAELGRMYHLNFKSLCEIPFDDEEMRVRF